MASLNVLGADGGIGGSSRTSCFLIDDDILIDAGTGLGDLPPDAMSKINHVFLSHIHMDHIACLPLMIDTVMSLRDVPVTVHVPGKDHEKLLEHVFNDVIWPDFTRIPDAENPALVLEPLGNVPHEINNRRIGALPVDHHGEAVGYWMSDGKGTLVFTGDTGPCPAFWEAVNGLPDLTHIIIECSFVNDLERLAHQTGHLTPTLLANELKQLKGNPQILATHMKPVGRETVLKELSELSTPHDIAILEIGQTIEF